MDKYDLLDEVTRVVLVESYNDLLSEYKSGGTGPIFSLDIDVEKKELYKLLKSFYRVIDWYSTAEQFTSIEKVSK